MLPACKNLPLQPYMYIYTHTYIYCFYISFYLYCSFVWKFSRNVSAPCWRRHSAAPRHVMWIAVTQWNTPPPPPGFRSSTCLVLRELKRFNFWLINDDSLNFSNHWTPLIQSQHLDGNWLLCYHPLLPHKNWMGYCWKLCCLAMIVGHDATWQVVFFALKTIMQISTVYTAISSPLFLKINNVALLTLFFQIVYTDDSAAQDCSGLD